MKKQLAIFCAVFVLVGCVTDRTVQVTELTSIADYCRVAQQVVTRTTQPVSVQIHASFDGFVKSKAIIPAEPGAIPAIQQFHWFDSSGTMVGVSCKLKSADHLNLVYGADTAGPDGPCQDMNRRIYRQLVDATTDLHYPAVVFDESESVSKGAVTGMTGPDWLKPYEAMYVDDDGRLHVRAKGFQVNFTDPRFARAPARFRGVHYCHFIAPNHLLAVMTGDAPPALIIGREVDTSGFKAPTH
ncbi:MAG: hypothetical protein QGH93_05235 [Gammaproteobacteria bacterium]|jgi:uncharacterized protein YcfL|nr:hypothetical protein [Gammaproteobacteria bacterium]